MFIFMGEKINVKMKTQNIEINKKVQVKRQEKNDYYAKK